MHHRTPAIDFLETPDGFLAALGAHSARVGADQAELGDHLGSHQSPTVLLLTAPG